MRKRRGREKERKREDRKEMVGIAQRDIRRDVTDPNSSVVVWNGKHGRR